MNPSLKNVLNRFIAIVMVVTIAQGCDDMNTDKMPPDEVVNPAENIVSTMTVNGPVLIDLVQSANLTGNATISIVEEPAKGKLVILSSALLQYTPFESFTSGSDVATYRVCVEGNCNNGALEFSYNGTTTECQRSAVYDRATGTPADPQVIVDVLRNDMACGEQFDVTTLKVVQAPEHGEAEPVDGLIFYYPADDFTGEVQLVYSVATRSNPGYLYYGLAQISLHAVPPVVVASPDAFTYTAEEFQAILNASQNEVNYSLEQVLGNDEIGELQYSELEISIVTQPQYGTADYQQMERFLYKPSDAFSGSDSFTYQICYNGNCSEAKVQITVNSPVQLIAHPEDIVLTRAQYDEMMNTYGALNFSVESILGNDEIGELTYVQLTVSIEQQPAGANVTYFSNEMFKFTPGDAFDGEESFVYKICYDGSCSEATVMVTVVGF